MDIYRIKKRLSRFLFYKILGVVRIYVACIISATISLLRLISISLSDHFYDRKMGIHTTEYYLFKEESRHGDMVPYYPTPYRDLGKIISMLQMNEQDVFVDIGCGQGRIVCYAALHELRQVIGIEIASDMVRIAESNRLACKNMKTPVEIIQCDASAWVPNHGTIFFMYNPFGLKTFRNVIRNIDMSCRQNPRSIRIVYSAPAFADILDEQEWLEREPDTHIREEVIVWRNKPAVHSSF